MSEFRGLFAMVLILGSSTPHAVANTRVDLDGLIVQVPDDYDDTAPRLSS